MYSMVEIDFKYIEQNIKTIGDLQKLVSEVENGENNKNL
jgi:hypothetical protein